MRRTSHFSRPARVRLRSQRSFLQLEPPRHPLFHRFFIAKIARLVPGTTAQTLRQVLLRQICVGRVERVLVSLAVPELLQQRRRCLSDMEWDRLGGGRPRGGPPNTPSDVSPNLTRGGRGVKTPLPQSGAPPRAAPGSIRRPL